MHSKKKKMSRILQIAMIGSIIILNSCSNKNLSNYYFPINQKSETKIYKYVDPKNIEPDLYWKTVTNPIKKTLITESFNSNFELYNTFEEHVENGKAQLINYIDYEVEYNSTSKEIIGVIKENQVFNADKSETYSYRVEYKNKLGNISYKKKRKFLAFEQIKIQGKKYNTAKFKDELFIKIINSNDEFEFHEISYYAKGIGMVKLIRYAPTNEVLIFELEKVMTEKEFEKIKTIANQ